MRPLFTIITVTYNAERTIRRTLQSVSEQTCRLYEHLVIDGKSTDGTLSVIAGHNGSNIRLISERDSGIYDAMNKGITHAKGEYLIFLNAGDTFHSGDTLQHYADAIAGNGYPGIVYGQTDIVDLQGNYLGPRHLTAPETLTLEALKDGMVVCHQAMAVNSQIAVLYNLKYKYSADYEWCIICLQHSRHNVLLPEVTIDYMSEGMTTANHRKSLAERFKIMCTYYGIVSTLLHHLKFAARYIRRRKTAPNIQ